MGNTWNVGLVLLLVVIIFTGAGIVYARMHGGSGTLEDYITARGSVGAVAAAITLVASSMGGWILFSPAESATWGGLPALVGYSLGAAAPLLVFIPLGKRLRQVMPEGHTLTEYVWHRYGRGMYLFSLVVMLFYMFIFLAAEVTGLALLAKLIANIPLWLTAGVVTVATLAYTAYGGLRASIFTDLVQSLLILPLLVLVVLIGYVQLGGSTSILNGLDQQAPELLRWNYLPGLQGALTLFIAVVAANLFHQGYWQRIYAVRDRRALVTGFGVAALLIVPIVFALGAFGLAAVATDRAATPSIAFFNVLLDVAPAWLRIGLVVLGLGLVMSSVDTLINGIASIVAVDLRRVLPTTHSSALLRISRWFTVVLAVPLVLIAAQGYSVLYLFLIADLVCAATVVPVFYGLYSERYTGQAALASAMAGLITGGLLFPDPAMTRGSLLGAFGTALLVSTLAAVLLRSRQRAFDLGSLRTLVHAFRD